MRAQSKERSSRTGKAAQRPRSSAERVRAYRAKMKKQGMRLIQMWVPDARSPKFKAELRREIKLINRSPESEEALRFIESHSADWDE